MTTGGRDAGGVEPIALGVVSRPHGIRGEVRVHLHNPESDLLLEQADLLLRGGDGSVRPVIVERARRGPHGPILRLRGVDDRDGAEALRGTEVCVPRDRLPDAEDDEWYVADLVGTPVRDERGEVVGEVVDVLSYPSIDCLVVATPEGDREVPMIEPWLGEVEPGVDVRVARLHEAPLTTRRRGR